MKISKTQATIEDWDQVHSLNYKMVSISPYQSVVYAELNGDHGKVSTKGLERVYYIINGQGEFDINGEITAVSTGDVITIPPFTEYDYRPMKSEVLKIILFMELWDN